MPTSRRATKADPAKQTDSAPSSVSKAPSKRASAASAKAEEPKSPKSPKQRKPAKPKEKKQDVKKQQEEAPAAVAARPKLPVWAQFPLLATLSFSMASMGYSLLGAVTKGELAAVSRSQDTWGEVAILAGWRL